MTRRLVAFLLLALAVAWGGWIRVDTALADPNFDAHDARGLLRSDPALLYYLTERIVEAGGGVPADFHAEPRIQHPYATDVPAEFPIGQEFLVAWTQRLVGARVPLHVTALWVMGFVAASFLVGIFVAVRALTASDAWAALACALALVTPANYRTIGFLLVGEDLALPLYALHLGFAARAARSGRARDFLACGLFAAGALSTWHASSFVLTLELGVLFLALLVRGASPLAAPRAWLALVPPAAAGVLVPVLRANGLLVSPACALALALVAPAVAAQVFAAQRGPLSRARVRVLACVVLVAALPVFGALAPASYAHVYEVVWAKLRWLGRFPDDPERISFDARLLWQGPFETLPLADLLAWCGWPLALAFAAGFAALLRRRREAPGFAWLVFALACAALPVAWMFARLAVLPGLLAPVAAASGCASSPRRAPALALFGALVLAQAVSFAGFVRGHAIAWYQPLPARAELAALIDWVGANVPPDEPIAGDFVNSTALLAHTRRPIVLQPKYETDRSRRQAEVFLHALFQGSTAELAELLRTRFRCRYLLVDRYVLWGSRATAGLRADERAPRAGTAAAEFLSTDEDALRHIPGFELVYRGKPVVCVDYAGRFVGGADYRLFRLE